MGKKYIVFTLVFAAISVSVAIAQKPYFPDQYWQEKNPGELKVKAGAISDAVEFALGNEYQGSRDLRQAILKGFEREPFHEIVGPTKKRGGPAGLIVKNGYIIAKWGDLDRVDMTFSVTKSYLSTVAGLAYDRKLIAVKDRVSDLVWDKTFAGKHNEKITWDHLLTQSSDWSGALFEMRDWADRPPREGDIDDWKNRKFEEPGSKFEYNDVRVNVLSYSLLNLWRESLPHVLKSEVMDPIGASTTWRWFGYNHSWVNIDGYKVQSVSGGGHSGGGIFINTWDQARFGLLFLRNGNWDGKQIISKEWISRATTSSKANESYGYMWWLNKGNRKWEGIDENVFYAAGFGGNFIVIDQDKDLMVVTRWLEPSKIGEFIKIVYQAL
ncbi:MAG: serine hydrolase [Bacteroidota bacterium]